MELGQESYAQYTCNEYIHRSNVFHGLYSRTGLVGMHIMIVFNHRPSFYALDLCFTLNTPLFIWKIGFLVVSRSQTAFWCRELISLAVYQRTYHLYLYTANDKCPVQKNRSGYARLKF